jgi:hypothetical protein
VACHGQIVCALLLLLLMQHGFCAQRCKEFLDRIVAEIAILARWAKRSQLGYFSIAFDRLQACGP